MEENRLTPMKEGYDKALFNEIYEKTQGLRRKLAAGIDSKRFGVDYQEILSWFDVKFIFAFNKYWGTMDDNILLGHIIKSLEFYKCRILRSAYTKKYSQHIVPIEDFYELEEYEVENPYEDSFNDRVGEATRLLKEQISDNAMLLLDVQLNPPLYIQEKAKELNLKKLTKIPNPIYAEYLGLGDSEQAVEYIESLKKEINRGISKVREMVNTLS